MDYGFYHPDRGYWQTIGEPPVDILAGYPEGTVQVPLKPGANHDWNGTEWVYVEPPALSDEERTLSPRRFTYLLKYSDLDDVWQAMIAATKGVDQDTYARLNALLNQPIYRLSKTLAAVTDPDFAALAATVAPDADISEANIRAQWEIAENAVIDV